jgi:hypothetical protein
MILGRPVVRSSGENEKKKVQTRCLDQGKSSAPTWPSELFWVWILGWLAFGARLLLLGGSVSHLRSQYLKKRPE